MRIIRSVLCCIPFAWLAAAGPSCASPAVKTDPTLGNLTMACARALNDQAACLAYAAKAEKDGYLKVAHLFRAAANSKGVQAATFNKALKKMKGKVEIGVKAAVVGTTKANLKKALDNETLESTIMYAGSLKAAKEKNRAPAVRAFNFAVKVGEGHAAMYRDALANLKGWKADGKFYVCQECGNTVATVDFPRCPICHESKSEFKEIP